MKNPTLAKKLEACAVNLPSDYGRKILTIDSSPDVRGYADGIEHNRNLFFADLQVDVGLQQLFIRIFLNLEQPLCFEIN